MIECVSTTGGGGLSATSLVGGAGAATAAIRAAVVRSEVGFAFALGTDATTGDSTLGGMSVAILRAEAVKAGLCARNRALSSMIDSRKATRLLKSSLIAEYQGSPSDRRKPFSLTLRLLTIASSVFIKGPAASSLSADSSAIESRRSSSRSLLS